MDFQRRGLITDREIEAVVGVLRSQKLTLLEGFQTRHFERQFAEWVGSKHAIAVNSGTAALHVALAAANISTGDEVIIPPFTFIATASSALHNNAIPVFADIDPDTFNIDPADVRAKITQNTRAIVPVHLAGNPCDVGEILAIAREHALVVIEDACQAHGAEWEGRKVGTWGDLGTFSFYPTKNMTTGEGGMVVTDDDALAEQARLFRHHGESSWYVYDRLGWNYRMTEVQAAIGSIQVDKLDQFVETRRDLGSYLAKLLPEVGVQWVHPQAVHPAARPSYNWWAARLDLPAHVSRDEYLATLNAERNLTHVIYPQPLYECAVFQEKRAYKHGCPWSCPFHEGAVVEYPPGICPTVERVCPQILYIDMHPGLRRTHMDYIAHRMRITEERLQTPTS